MEIAAAKGEFERMKPIRKFLYPFFIAVLFFLVYLLDRNVPKEVRWDYDFTSLSKTTMGCKILRDNLSYIFPGQSIKNIYENPYVELYPELDANKTLLIINDEFHPGVPEIERLSAFIENGGIVFISAFSFSKEFTDQFGFSLHSDTKFSEKDILLLRIDADTSLKYSSLIKFEPLEYFSSDGGDFEILGTNAADSINYISINYGKGRLFLHLLPWVFGNYYMTEPTVQLYPYKVLSSLPLRDILWDEHYKSGKQLITSPLRFVLRDDYLKWAYYILLVSMILYLIFHARREQRVIPVIKPYENTTLQFLQRIALLNKFYKSKEQSMTEVYEKFQFSISRIFKTEKNIFSDHSMKIIEKSVPGSGEKLMQIRNAYLLASEKRGKAEFIQFNTLIHQFYTSYGLYGK